MSSYNNVSRSRSKERSSEEDEERNNQHDETKKEQVEDKEKIKELDRDKIIEILKEEKKIREKEWDKERSNYLQRENDLLREINRMKYQENIYNQDTTNKYGFKNYHYPKYYKPYNPIHTKFSSFGRTSYFNDNLRNRYQYFSSYNPGRNYDIKRENFTNYNEKKYENPISELDKLLSNFNRETNPEPKLEQFRKKIFLPKNQKINLVGLLIGPKGIFQKLLEKQSGCKIYINGKNISKKERFFSLHDTEEPHVLIIANTEEKLRRGTKLIEEIIYSDDDTKNKIISEQIIASKKEGFESLNYRTQKNEEKSEEYLKTRRGLTGKDAKFFKVPDEYINAIVGSNGETIKRIEIESNCKIEVGNAPIPNTKLRYVFIEGTEENYNIAKDLIEKVIGSYANNNANENSN